MLRDKLLKQIDDLKLDLSGKVVLTEAASGAYVVTPILAALAGAEVYAYTRSTRYGTAEEVIAKSKEAIAATGKDLNIHFITDLEPEVIAKADIITNSGHLRPLNAGKLQYAKKGAVIPLMYEAWEWRNADVDKTYCIEKNIVIGATNERHPNVDVFNYLGDMAIKMIFDAGLTPYRNKFILICNNDFGPYMAKPLVKVCGALGVIDKPENRTAYPEGIEWLSDFPDISIPSSFEDAEAVIFTAYPFEQDWIGHDTPLSAAKLKNQLKDPYLLRYAGDVDTKALDELQLHYYPAHVSSGHMGIIPSEIGPDPIIKLQSGGLKVGEMLLKGETMFAGTELAKII